VTVARPCPTTPTDNPNTSTASAVENPVWIAATVSRRVAIAITSGGESTRAPDLDPDAAEAATIDGRPAAVTAIAGDATVMRR
jgi:hypothetical protein